jgi:hypothetical protein
MLRLFEKMNLVKLLPVNTIHAIKSKICYRRIIISADVGTWSVSREFFSSFYNIQMYLENGMGE